MSTLKFYPYQSAVDPGFWHTLAKKKLEEFKLSEECRFGNLTLNYFSQIRSKPNIIRWIRTGSQPNEKNMSSRIAMQ